MIRRIEEHNNLDLFGEDFVHFHIFFDNKDGIEVKMPWIISFWNNSVLNVLKVSKKRGLI